MASTINASNASGGGIIYSADSSGTLSLQGAGTTGMSVNSSGQLQMSFGGIVPQGRLTLATGTPVMTSAQTSKTTLYYTAYVGNVVPVYNGTVWTLMTFSSDLSNITTNSSTGSAGPAAVTTNSNYDLFIWSNSGTLTLTRGPAWTSDTARGTGAGTTQIAMQNGIWTNAVAITNGPSANQGTYVGTVRSDGSSQLNWTTGGAAAGGTAGILGVWNMYNRVSATAVVQDTTASWTYGTAAWRAADNSSTNRVNFIVGFVEDSFTASYTNFNYYSGGSTVQVIGLGLNSTTSPMAGGVLPSSVYTTGTYSGTSAVAGAQPALGYNYVSAIEYGDGSSSAFYGTYASTHKASNLTVTTRQ